MKVSANSDIRVVELFAGVGGFRVGLERCSERFKTIWANQWEPGQAGQWAYKCYDKNFGEDSHCVNADIATVIDQVPPHDLLVGGFPCQDYSVASTGAKGIEGKKGVLSVEINAGQMVEDVRLATNGTVPVGHFGRLGGIVPDPEEIVNSLKEHIKSGRFNG